MQTEGSKLRSIKRERERMRMEKSTSEPFNSAKSQVEWKPEKRNKHYLFLSSTPFNAPHVQQQSLFFLRLTYLPTYRKGSNVIAKFCCNFILEPSFSFHFWLHHCIVGFEPTTLQPFICMGNTLLICRFPPPP